MRAKRARLGASDHPLDERRAVMRLRLANKLKERDAYLAAYAVYTAQQAEAARFWQQQQLLQRQHALAAAAREVLAARQRAADAQRAAEQRAIDADARNAAAAAAAAREVLRADAAAWAAIELARAHERIRQLSAQQESVTASPARRGSSACRDDVSSACRDDVVFGRRMMRTRTSVVMAATTSRWLAIAPATCRPPKLCPPKDRRSQKPSSNWRE